MASQVSELGKFQTPGQIATFSPILTASANFVYDSSSDFARSKFVPLNCIIDATQATAPIILTYLGLTFTIPIGTVRCFPLTGTPGQRYTVSGSGQVQVVFLNGPLPAFEIPGASVQETQDEGIQSVLATAATAGAEGLQTYSIENGTRSGAPSPQYFADQYVSAVQQITGNANGDAFTLTNSTAPARIVLLEIAISAACETLPSKSGGIGFSLTQQEEQSAPIFYGSFFVSSTNGGQGKKRITFPGGLILPAYSTGVGLQMSQYDPEDTGAAVIYGIDFSYTSTLPS